LFHHVDCCNLANIALKVFARTYVRCCFQSGPDHDDCLGNSDAAMTVFHNKTRGQLARVVNSLSSSGSARQESETGAKSVISSIRGTSQVSFTDNGIGVCRMDNYHMYGNAAGLSGGAAKLRDNTGYSRAISPDASEHKSSAESDVLLLGSFDNNNSINIRRPTERIGNRARVSVSTAHSLSRYQEEAGICMTNLLNNFKKWGLFPNM